MYAIHRYGENSGRSRKTSGIVEMDEAYITACLKGSHDRILRLGRGPRRRGLKAKPGRSLWKNDKLPILILVERGGLELYIPSIDVRGETIGRIASRYVEQGSRIYTDGFPSYMILQSLGFSHE